MIQVFLYRVGVPHFRDYETGIMLVGICVIQAGDKLRESLSVMNHQSRITTWLIYRQRSCTYTYGRVAAILPQARR